MRVGRVDMEKEGEGLAGEHIDAVLVLSHDELAVRTEAHSVNLGPQQWLQTNLAEKPVQGGVP